MIVRGAIATGVVLAAASATITPSLVAGAEVQVRPRGQVVGCSASPGWGRRDEFNSRQNLIVGSFALERARPMLGYAPKVRGNKIFVYVRGGHRATVALGGAKSDVGFSFGQGSRRVVSFVACKRGERTPGRFDGWPVTSWVGFLLAGSPRCVPLRIWVDDEQRPRRALLRFGVPHCIAASEPPAKPPVEQPVACSADEVETLADSFVHAFNAGDFEALDRTFAHEPDFEWYSTAAPGERFIPEANDRASLVPYFRERHALGERLTLTSFKFNGNSTVGKPHGGFEYHLTRAANDLAPTPVHGKGAAWCYATRPDELFVWSMGSGA